MKTYNLFGHNRKTGNHILKKVRATTRNAAKNKVPHSMVLERVRLEMGRSRTEEQRIHAGASKHRHHTNRIMFGI